MQLCIMEYLGTSYWISCLSASCGIDSSNWCNHSTTSYPILGHSSSHALLYHLSNASPSWYVVYAIPSPSTSASNYPGYHCNTPPSCTLARSFCRFFPWRWGDTLSWSLFPCGGNIWRGLSTASLLLIFRRMMSGSGPKSGVFHVCRSPVVGRLIAGTFSSSSRLDQSYTYLRVNSRLVWFLWSSLGGWIDSYRRTKEHSNVTVCLLSGFNGRTVCSRHTAMKNLALRGSKSAWLCLDSGAGWSSLAVSSVWQAHSPSIFPCLLSAIIMQRDNTLRRNPQKLIMVNPFIFFRIFG